MSDELKPCPFCGGEAEFEYYWWQETVVIKCPKCGASSEPQFYENEAIEAWNKRVETSQFEKNELEFIIKVLLHDSVAKQTEDIMRINIIRKCQKLIKDSPLELLSVDKIALDRLLKRGEND